MITNFERGPFQLATRFVAYRAIGATVCFGALLFLLAVGSKMTYGGAKNILHEQELWNAGGQEIDASYQGQSTTRKFVMHSYKLTVDYETPDGTAHKESVEFDTLFGGLDENLDPKVRVSKDNPGDFALNVAVEASSSRWGAVALIGFGLLALSGALVSVAWSMLIQWRRAWRCANTGVPTLCPLVSRERLKYQGKPTGVEVFRFKVPSGVRGEEIEVKYQFKTKGSRALTLADDTLVFALVPPEMPTESIMVLVDYYPLVLSEAGKLQASAALAGAVQCRS